MNLIAREAVANDYAEINKLVLEVHNLHVKNRPDIYINTDTPLMREHFDDLLGTKDTKVFVIEDSEHKELAAYSIIKITTPRNALIFAPARIAYIDDFCVKSRYKKKGVGRFLFQHIAAYAKAEEASALHLTVWEFNIDAIKFYEAMGMNTMNRRMEINL